MVAEQSKIVLQVGLRPGGVHLVGRAAREHGGLRVPSAHFPEGKAEADGGRKALLGRRAVNGGVGTCGRRAALCADARGAVR